MNPRIVKAYLAGAALPTLVMLLVLALVFVARFVLRVAVPVERGLIFPMAVVPALFGFWNVLYIALHDAHPEWKIAVHGALFPVVMIPLGASCAVALDFLRITAAGALWFNQVTLPFSFLLPWFALVVLGYYLVWKYLVAYLNRVVELA